MSKNDADNSSVRMNVNLPRPLYNRFKAKAEIEELSVSAVIRDMVVKYVEQGIYQGSKSERPRPIEEDNPVGPILYEAITGRPPEDYPYTLTEFHEYWGRRMESEMREMDIMRKALLKRIEQRKKEAEGMEFEPLVPEDESPRSE